MKVVIVGSGLAGVTVAEGLAKSGKHPVSLVTAESLGYYSRPRLSHGLALADEAAAKIVMKRFDALKGVEVLAGTHAERIDRDAQELIVNNRHLPYDVLVLATGSAARIPPPLVPHRERFFTMNSLDDLLALRHHRDASGGRPLTWAVIGGGLIGCEVASDLRKAGDAVTIFHREDRLMELLFTPAQSRALHEHFSARGVDIRYNQILNDLPTGYDGVIVATGFAPRVDLAKAAGLATGRGIVVNEYLRSDDPSIYAVGDVWLASPLEGAPAPWAPPAFAPVVKIHDFKVPAEVA